MPTSGKEEKSKSTLSVLDIAGLTAGLVGAVAGLFWLFGRMYYLGSYEARGIPSSFIVYSTNDFIATGGLSSIIFLMYVVLIVFLTLLENAFIKELPITFQKIEKRIFQKRTEKFRRVFLCISLLIISILVFLLLLFWFDIPGSTLIEIEPIRWIILLMVGVFVFDVGILMARTIDPKESSSTPDARKAYLVARVSVYITLALFLFVNNLWISWKSGYVNGCKEKYNKSTIYTIYSNEKLPLMNPTTFPDLGETYIYSNYYGIIGEDYFVLYKSFDPTTGSIQELVFIQKSKIIGFRLESVGISETERLANQEICIRFADQRMENLSGANQTP